MEEPEAWPAQVPQAAVYLVLCHSTWNGKRLGPGYGAFTFRRTTPEQYRTDCAIEMMKRFAQAGQPWHLEARYIEPHDPYFPLKKYLDRYDPRSIPVP